MALVTGSAVGTLIQQEDLYIAGAPTFFLQDYTAGPWYNPDTDGFYWQLSGTVPYPVYEIGCATNVSLTEDITINDILCDNIGVVSTLQQRNFIEFNFTVQSPFPLSVLTHILKGGAVTETAPMEKFGLGKINNDLFWQCWAPTVYNESVGDYIGIQLHKAKFVDPFTVDMPFGDSWKFTGIKLRAYADTTKPSDQQFATFVRADASVIT